MSVSVGEESSLESRTVVRSGAIDFMRIVGIVAVVAGHVWNNDLTNRALYSWHVPFFFFLSGYLWTTGRSVRVELGNRFNTLGKPYLFWLGVLLVISVAVALSRGDFVSGDIAPPIYGGYFATRPFTAFWFVTVLLFAAILYRLIERLPAWGRYSIIVAGLVAGVTVGELLARTPLSIGSAWPCLAFMVAGGEWRKVEHKVRWPALVGAALLAGSVTLVATGLSAPLNIKQGDYGTPVLSIVVACAISAGGLLLAKAVCDVLPGAFSNVAIWLGKAGFIVVFTHAVPLMFLGTTADGGWVDFALALCVPWVLGLLLIVTSLAPWAGGMNRQPACIARLG